MAADRTSGTGTEGDARTTEVGFLVLRRTRPGFDHEWGGQMEDAAREALRAVGRHPREPDVAVTEPAALPAALAQLERARCETAVVLQPTIGDGRIVPTLAQQWRGGLVLWATPERPTSEKVSSCSLVATHLTGSLMRQLGRPFELVYGDPGEEATRADLRDAVAVTAAATRLGRSRVGLVGSHAPGFINLHADPVPLQEQVGPQLERMDLYELMNMVRDRDPTAVQEDVAAAGSVGVSEGDMTEEDLRPNSAYYLAISSLLADKALDAVAIRCWPELPNAIGQWPYLAMARHTAEGRVVALEGDVDGAVTGLMSAHLGLGPGYISDWLEHDDEAIHFWHPGHAPWSMCKPIGSEEGPRLGRHFNSETPMVVDAALAADMPITLVRLWRCDGRYHMTAADGRTVERDRRLRGASGRAVFDGRKPHPWLLDLCHAGMPHHVTLVPGHHAARFQRLAHYLGVEWVG